MIAESPSHPAAIILDRRQARRDLSSWARKNGFDPSAVHHQLIIKVLQDITFSTSGKKVMILIPPGTAKSTYASVLFPPWFLANRPGANILACSYSFTLAERFGKRCRNIIENHANTLGYTLSKHSQAAGDWETSTNGVYFAAGVGAGIAGHRADLGLIDDYLGSQEDADSKLVREKQWDWYFNDFWPRLKPNASIVIIANRRHEEDLVGKLMEKEGDTWEVIRIPYFAEANDPLGRAEGERIWADWFTEAQAEQVKTLPPRTFAGLYQQRPAPEEGDYFKREWLIPYKLEDLPTNLRIYAASDHAVSEETGSNRSCFIAGGLDSNNVLWILPDLWWKQAGPVEAVDAFIALMQRRQPIVWWAEKGHISKSIGPFLKERMLEQNVYGYIKEVTPVRAKDVRARSIQGRMAMGTVRFPTFTSWWPSAEHELLTFPGGKSDDLVDALAHLGLGLGSMVKASQPKSDPPELSPDWRPTLKWVRQSDKNFRKEPISYGGR